MLEDKWQECAESVYNFFVEVVPTEETQASAA